MSQFPFISESRVGGGGGTLRSKDSGQTDGYKSVVYLRKMGENVLLFKMNPYLQLVMIMYTLLCGVNDIHHQSNNHPTC